MCDFAVPQKRYMFSHYDYVEKVPDAWQIIKQSEHIWMAYESETKNMGIEFHPEVTSSIAIAFFSAWWNWVK